MTEKPVLILYYLPTSTYALNVLLGALESKGLDLRVQVFLPRSMRHLTEIVEGLNTENVVILWSFFSAAFPNAREHLDSLRQKNLGCRPINIAGGVHASAEPKQVLLSGFDFVAVGEGEQIVVDIVYTLLASRDFQQVKGLSWLSEGVLRTAGPAKRVDLNEFPPFAAKHRKFNPIEITRGCIYACKFCQTPFMFKALFRHRTIENVVKYVETMKQFGLLDVRFISPTSLSYGSNDDSVDLRAVEGLLSAVREAIGADGKIFFGSFPSEVRPEHVTPEALSILRKYVSNDNIIIGAQSGSPAVLEYVKRGHGTDEIERAVSCAVAAGFVPNVDFIFGLPGETEKDARLSVQFADKLSNMGARIHGHTFMPLPGTPFRDEQPGRISPRIARQLDRMTSRGKLYGKWKRQITIADEMAQNQFDASIIRAEDKRRKYTGSKANNT